MSTALQSEPHLQRASARQMHHYLLEYRRPEHASSATGLILPPRLSWAEKRCASFHPLLRACVCLPVCPLQKETKTRREAKRGIHGDRQRQDSWHKCKRKEQREAQYTQWPKKDGGTLGKDWINRRCSTLHKCTTRKSRCKSDHPCTNTQRGKRKQAPRQPKATENQTKQK
jgi:hypothetical protein